MSTNKTDEPATEDLAGVVVGNPAAPGAPSSEDTYDFDLTEVPAPGVVVPTPAEEKPKTRDAIRAKIFAAKPKFELVEDFYGTDIELRQPDLATALEARNAEENEHVFTMLLDYAYVPGTNEKVFEEADVEAIRALPFGPEMTNLLGKVNKLLGIDGEAIAEMLKDATKST